MADNYMQMSEMLVLRTEKETTWVREMLEKIDQVVHEHDEEEKDRFANFPKWVADWYETYNEVGFEWEIEADGLWIHGDYVNPDAVAEFVRRFLKEFNPNGHWSMSWAGTCSKPRLGEFHGGMAFVTANKAHFLDPWAWLAQKKKEFLAKKKGRKKK